MCDKNGNWESLDSPSETNDNGDDGSDGNTHHFVFNDENPWVKVIEKSRQ